LALLRASFREEIKMATLNVEKDYFGCGQNFEPLPEEDPAAPKPVKRKRSSPKEECGAQVYHDWYIVEKDGRPAVFAGPGFVYVEDLKSVNGCELTLTDDTVIYLGKIHPAYAEYIRRNCIETFDPENPIRLREYYERKAQEEQDV